jgi:hypothetical protein
MSYSISNISDISKWLWYSILLGSIIGVFSNESVDYSVFLYIIPILILSFFIKTNKTVTSTGINIEHLVFSLRVYSTTISKDSIISISFSKSESNSMTPVEGNVYYSSSVSKDIWLELVDPKSHYPLFKHLEKVTSKAEGNEKLMKYSALLGKRYENLLQT